MAALPHRVVTSSSKEIEKDSKGPGGASDSDRGEGLVEGIRAEAISGQKLLTLSNSPSAFEPPVQSSSSSTGLDSTSAAVLSSLIAQHHSGDILSSLAPTLVTHNLIPTHL